MAARLSTYRGPALLILSAPCWWLGAWLFFPTVGSVYSAREFRDADQGRQQPSSSLARPEPLLPLGDTRRGGRPRRAHQNAAGDAWQAIRRGGSVRFSGCGRRGGGRPLHVPDVGEEAAARHAADVLRSACESAPCRLRCTDALGARLLRPGVRPTSASPVDGCDEHPFQRFHARRGHTSRRRLPPALFLLRPVHSRRSSTVSAEPRPDERNKDGVSLATTASASKRRGDSRYPVFPTSSCDDERRSLWRSDGGSQPILGVRGQWTEVSKRAQDGRSGGCRRSQCVSRLR